MLPRGLGVGIQSSAVEGGDQGCLADVAGLVSHQGCLGHHSHLHLSPHTLSMSQVACPNMKLTSYGLDVKARMCLIMGGDVLRLSVCTGLNWAHMHTWQHCPKACLPGQTHTSAHTSRRVLCTRQQQVVSPCTSSHNMRELAHTDTGPPALSPATAPTLTQQCLSHLLPSPINPIDPIDHLNPHMRDPRPTARFTHLLHTGQGQEQLLDEGDLGGAADAIHVQAACHSCISLRGQFIGIRHNPEGGAGAVCLC